jgi:hypothetical protein
MKEVFGDFEYASNKNGSITILGGWIKQNIVKIRLGRRTIWCHRLMADSFKSVYRDLKDAGLERHFDVSNGGGCFVARHKCWKTTRRLSHHSWGIAIDLNPKKYPYGSDKNPPKEVVRVFKKHGFIHGGDWRSKDGMHFQWRRFV